MINYWLAPNTPGPVTIEILSPGGSLIRRLSSEAPAVRPAQWPDLRAPDMTSSGTRRLTKNAGINRAIWDLAYPGPWDSLANRSGNNGPMVAPGNYVVRLTANGVSESRPLAVRADPRALRDGITTGNLAAQLAHNLRVRDMVSEVNIAVAELGVIAKRVDGKSGSADLLRRLRSMQQLLVTPPIRYSEPALQGHIQYLYGAALDADQRVGRDAQMRYTQLRKQLDAALRELRSLIAAVGD
jgi:hypothetical protein